MFVANEKIKEPLSSSGAACMDGEIQYQISNNET